MKRFLAQIPRNVVVALAVLMANTVIFGLLWFTLGNALVEAAEANARLTRDIQQANADTETARADVKYVIDNQTKYEALIKSDRLVPHTRRVAIMELQRVAHARGISQLNYKFSSAAADSVTAAAAQPTTGAYRLSVDEVELALGAPTDGGIYRFVDDITQSFPGSAVVRSMTLSRAATVTSDALKAVSSGADSGLVKGEVVVTWRTAQANENPKESQK